MALQRLGSSLVKHKGELLSSVLDGMKDDIRRNEERSWFVIPEDFGAKGDGVTDDTHALQAALDSGKLLVLHNKEYKASNLFLRNKTCSILGTGLHSARISQLSGVTGALMTVEKTCSLITLENFGLYGIGAQQGTSFTTVGTKGLIIPAGAAGVSPDYPFNSTDDPRRDIFITNLHIAGFEEVGLDIQNDNFSVSVDGLFIRHINRVGAKVSATDWTWSNLQIDTCGEEALIMKGAGNCRILGAKLIWGNWKGRQPHPGLLIDNCQNVTMSCVEVQDCGADGVHFKDSFTIYISGLNTNRNSINTNMAYNNLVFENSDVVIDGFIGLNYASTSSGANSSAANFRWLDNNSSVRINGIVESENTGLIFIGDNNIIQPTTSDVIINGLPNYNATYTVVDNHAPTFSSTTNLPVYENAPPIVGQPKMLKLTQAAKDKLKYDVRVPRCGSLVSFVFSPDVTNVGTMQLVSLGDGFGASLHAALMQFEVKSDGKQAVSILLSGDGTTQVLSATLPEERKLKTGGVYHIAFGAAPSRFWWSILDMETGKRTRRAHRKPQLNAPFNSIFDGTRRITVFSGASEDSVACEGKGAKVYVGSFSSESDYVASRYYGYDVPVDMSKLISFRGLSGGI